MSAQTISESAIAPIWSGWQSTVINGLYPLQRFVNGSERSAVFLTERTGEVVSAAAVKIIPVERVTLSQLTHWRLATGLNHPHLIQLFDAGLCHFGGRQFLFVVMENAEQTLAEVLGQRPLTPEEVRELLPPTLEALTFLHRKGLVQGQLKPANILVVGDQLKLASDSIRPAGAPRAGIAELSAYDPPEADYAASSSADDIWGLGITLVEALTQTLPWRDEQSETVRLPNTIPVEFLVTVQRCLNFNHAVRPLAMDLQAQFSGAPTAPIVRPPQPIASEPPPTVPIAEPPRQLGTSPAAIAIAIAVLALLGAVWAAAVVFRTYTNPRQSGSAAIRVSSQPAAFTPRFTSGNAVTHLAPPVATVPVVIRAQMPRVPRSALSTIHGHIQIAVLVSVDHSGAVTEAFLKNTGPSAYFARLAREAARKWQFAPAADPAGRKWLLQFEFTHGGVTGVAKPPQN